MQIYKMMAYKDVHYLSIKKKLADWHSLDGNKAVLGGPELAAAQQLTKTGG